MSGPPLVTIGIPTFNRAASLQRAVRSALTQDHAAIEVVVGDDASTDETESVVRGLGEHEPRLRYLRHPRNTGHARNFQAVLEAADGDYFMWLSDDDWIDASYVSSCLGVLAEHPDHSLVCGLARYYSEGRHVVDERPTDLLSGRPGARVIAYLARVNVNGALYGVARRGDLERIGFRDVVGGDWLLVSALAAQGRVRTLRDVHIHRSLDGLSGDEERLARSFGIGGALARRHHFLVAAQFGREIARSQSYRRLTPPQRAVTAALATILIVLRFPVYSVARAVLRRLGAGSLEDRLIAWVRSRD